MKNIYLKRINNNRGAALLIGYIVLFALVSLSSSVALFNFNDLNYAKRHKDTVAAFWLAESGINDYLADPSILDEAGSMSYPIGRGTVYLVKDDSKSTVRKIIATGVIGEIQKSIQIEYPAAPGVFDQTISVQGDMEISGKKSVIAVNDRLRLSGNILNQAKHSTVFIEDKREKINPRSVSLLYPDMNGNGVRDEFLDFISYNRNIVQSYDKNEIVYIRGNDTHIIAPDEKLIGKKIIYVEGEEGKGNVQIQFSGAWPEGQNLTIISTGTVTNNLAGMMNKSTQLNIIAWSGYKETSILPSSHKGVIFTHGKATFDEIHDASITSGSIIANDGIVFNEIWSMKTFNYADTRVNGQVPPGFEGLIGGGVNNYAIKPNVWKEIYI